MSERRRGRERRDEGERDRTVEIKKKKGGRDRRLKGKRAGQTEVHVTAPHVSAKWSPWRQKHLRWEGSLRHMDF